MQGEACVKEGEDTQSISTASIRIQAAPLPYIQIGFPHIFHGNESNNRLQVWERAVINLDGGDLLCDLRSSCLNTIQEPINHGTWM